MLRVVVVGAGYAGLTCALRIARKAGGRAQVTLINGNRHFVERIRLHQQVAGQAQPVLALDELVRGTGVQLQLGWVQDVNLAQRTLRVDGESLSWDQLVLATGSEFADAQVEGAREHAFTLDARSLPWLEAALPAIARRSGQVAVVGGGLTGIEVAAELAETYPTLRVVLLTRAELAPECSPAAREHIRATLQKLGVALRERTEVLSVHAGHLRTSQAEVAFSACLWAVGFRASPLAREAGLPVNQLGQVLVDASLRAQGHGDLHVIGDLVQFPSLPMGCKSAFPTAIRVADNIVRSLDGRPPFAFRAGRVPYCLSLGRREALIQLPLDGGERRARHLRGRLATHVKELICRGTLWALRAESKLARVAHTLRFRAAPALASEGAHV